MLLRALEGDRPNKMATRIARKAATTEKKIIVKSDELAKKGTTDGTPMRYSTSYNRKNFTDKLTTISYKI
jgi:hypothetical protein